MRQPLFSLILCMNGVEQHVFDAVTSLLAQSFKDFELILIDDYSADRSTLRALRAAGDDPRVRMIHNKENLGLPASRNIGIDKARGQYVAFPDAEDIAAEDYLQLAADVIKVCQPDIVVEGVIEDFFNHRGDVSYSKEHIPQTEDFPETLNDKVGIFQGQALPSLVQVLEKYELMHHIYTKFFKRSLVGDERFETQKHYSEDFFFTLDMFERAQSVAVISAAPYRYERHLRRQKQLSLTKGTFIERHRRVAASQLHQEENHLDTLSSRQFLGALYMRYIMAELGRMENPSAEIRADERKHWLAFLKEDPLFKLLVADTEPGPGVMLKFYSKVLLAKHPGHALRLARVVAFLKSFGPNNYSRTQE